MLRCCRSSYALSYSLDGEANAAEAVEKPRLGTFSLQKCLTEDQNE
jgi:hypothetical protein